MMSADTPKINLDDDSLVMLLSEVSAMAASGRPLISGLADLDDASMGKIGRAARAVRSGIDRGQPASESIASLSRVYQAPLRVAMEVMARTGSTVPIDEAGRLIRQSNQSRRRIRIASINPVLNVIVAAAVLFFVMPWILVSLSESQLIRPAFAPSITEICQAFAQDFLLAAIATLIVVGLFSLVLYWGFSRSRRGNGLDRDHATFCRWLAIQISPPDRQAATNASDLELGRLIGSAAEVAGPAFAASWAGVIEKIHGGTTSESSLAMPPDTPGPVRRCVADLVCGNREGESITLDLQRLSDLYTQKSLRHQTWWTEMLPRLVTGALMIGMMVILLRAIVMPLLDIVGEVVP
ncbi:Bacterial type II secretion system protein F domain protein [Stieleria neptunia]|uniref:Bacterial type II secretion system protein F domain protein n=1 Tax=Stieleria neptunia TaxID=2527979 RepID=A0A518HUH9_9BACT|nr:type II secretion system F family protein [Stieleria neptunia]QDV44453.1 Bacterial type II secretion system protein F domain protein [Stieleria neptunia]